MTNTSTTMKSSTHNTQTTRKAIVLGSTGSIGVNTLEVINNLNGQYQIAGLAAGSNTDKLAHQAITHGVNRVAISDPDARSALQASLPNAKVYAGQNATVDLVNDTDADMLVAAVVGSAGLPATIAAIEKGMDIALANKETLVAAGELVVPLVKKHRVKMLPVDSEHSAIFQCLPSNDPDDIQQKVKKIILTASGGPFRNATLEQIQNATVTEALNHPTWNMGPKITIDSATMMNKALEIIEAHWLFGLASNQIDVIIHPQSIAHSFVEFTDHSILAQLGPPDMKTPIQYALTYPDRAPGCSNEMDWAQLSQLDFESPDFERFPALKLAYRVIETGGTSGAIMNAANEVAVDAFLNEKIRFGQIVSLVEQAMNNIPSTPVSDLDTVIQADHAARQFIRQQVGE